MGNWIAQLESWTSRHRDLIGFIGMLAAVAIVLVAIVGYSLHDFISDSVKQLPPSLGQQVISFLVFLVAQPWFWLLAGLSIGLLLGVWVARRIPVTLSRKVVTPSPERTESRGFGIEITYPRSGQTFVTSDSGVWVEAQGTYKIRPEGDVFAFVRSGEDWWPQILRLSFDEPRQNQWQAKVKFGRGRATLHIVSVNELGVTLVEYYRKVFKENELRTRLLKSRGVSDELLKDVPGNYPSIEMTKLPDGLYEEAKVDVVVERDSAPKSR
jgi:hypothetical protein